MGEEDQLDPSLSAPAPTPSASFFDGMAQEEAATQAPVPVPVDQEKTESQAFFDDIAATEADQERQQLNQTLGIAVRGDPEKKAVTSSIAKTVGLPSVVVERNQEQIEQQQRIVKIRELADADPILKRQLMDPAFASIAHDDVESLSAMGTLLRAPVVAGKALWSGAHRLEAGLSGLIAAPFELYEGLLRDTHPGMEQTIYGKIGDFFRQHSLQHTDTSEQMLGHDYTFTENAVLSGLQSLGQMAPLLLGAVITRDPKLILGPMASAVGGEEYIRASEKGLTPGRAAIFGATQGAIEAATEMIPMKWLIGDIVKATPFFKMLGKQLAIENFTEQFATHGQDLVDWLTLRPDATVGEYLKERPDAFMATVISTTVAAGLQTGGAHLINKMAERMGVVEKAQMDQEVLKKIFDLAKASKLAQRDNTSFQNYVNEAAKDGETKNIWINGQALQQAAVTAGVNLDEVLPSAAEQLRSTTTPGGDVMLSTGEVMAKVTGTELEQAFLDHGRFDPKGMSVTEAQEYMKTEGPALKAEVERVLAEKKVSNQFKVSQDIVRAQILNQLTKANRFTNDVNNVYADMTSLVYASIAAHDGITPEEAMAKYPLGVRATAIPGTQRMEQDEFVGPKFFSAVTKTIESNTLKSAPGAQWAGMLKNTPGVKAEELEWIGVNEWLAEQDGNVTKEQLLEFLRANEIQVEEVEKGGGSELATVEAWWNDEGGANEEKPWADLTPREQHAAVQQYRDDVGQYSEDSADTKFSSYQLPGGSNYRELLLTLPTKDDAVVSKVDGKWVSADVEGELDGKFSEADARRHFGNKMRASARAKQFKSTHYDEPNILAHVRFNERTDADGKRVLFIEEIQSDWHQKGRKAGYKSGRPWTDAEYDRYSKIKDKPWESRTEDEKNFITDLDRRKQKFNNPTGGEVPDAPFKTTWPELAFKRMLRYAAENGFERIAWTTGEQQADRYDLSKQIDMLEVMSITHKPDTVIVNAWKGSDQVIKKQVPKTELPDLIGKELAEKATNDLSSGMKKEVAYEGLDLKIGGEGMRGFYDKMLPSMVNKLTKKWGGKVGTTRIHITERDEVHGTSRLGYTTEAGGGIYLGRSQQEAMRKVYEMNRPEVHSIDITPAIRQAVLGGQPLFQRGFDTTRSMPEPADAAGNLRRKLKRKEGVGGPANKRIVLKDGDTTVIIGEKTVEDWQVQIESLLTSSEITEAAAWYAEAAPLFKRVFGDQWEKHLTAWLAANQNESPSGALRNVLRVAEQIHSGTKGKLGGLAHDKIIEILSGNFTGRGFGPKLYDFVDSANLRTTRTWMGDDPQGGQPAVIDVHSVRDAGFVDETMQKALVRRFGEKAEGLEVDLVGAPSETQYERGSEYLNAVTASLNAQNWRGRSDWKAFEIQAIGWFADGKVTTPVESLEELLTKNLRQISTELDFGAGAPMAETFPQFSDMSFDGKSKVTADIMEMINAIARDIVGSRTFENFVGAGKWGSFPAQPSMQIYNLSTEEGAQDVADIIGYLAQQTEVWIHRAKKSGNKHALDVWSDDPRLADQEFLNDFWQRVSARVGRDDLGVSPMRMYHLKGQGGLRSIMKTKGDRDLSFIEYQLIPAIDAVAAELDIDVESGHLVVDVETRGNDWKRYKDGRQYLSRLRKRYGPGIQDRLQRHASEVEARIAESVASADEQPRVRYKVQEESGRRSPSQGVKGPNWLTLPNIRGGTSIPSFSLRPRQADSVAVYGVHYSGITGLTSLDPAMAGTGSVGTELRRFGKGKRTGVGQRVYFYAQGDSVKLPVPEATVSRGATYRVRLDNLYDLSEDPRGLWAKHGQDQDAREEEIVALGYDGFVVDAKGAGHSSPVAVVFDLDDAQIPVQNVALQQLRQEAIRDQGRTRDTLPGTAPTGLRDRGRVSGGAGVAQAPATAAAGAAPAVSRLGPGERLRGLPATVRFGGTDTPVIPSEAARAAAEAYMADAGLPYNPPQQFTRVDPDRAQRIASAYEAMAHNPSDPDVRAAYAAMIEETLAQYQFIKATGLKIEMIPPGKDPYAASPRAAIQDVIENNHLWVFPTAGGFGGTESQDQDFSDNPLLEPTDEFIGDYNLLANDVFRIAHDYFGHIKEGVGFRADGEENAWRSHSAMYSPLARRAMTSETRGQNSWVNFGPFGEKNQTASAGDTEYAPQKAGLMPEWVATEGAEDAAQEVAKPGILQRLAQGVKDLVTKNKPAGIRFKVERDEDDEGTFVFAYSTTEKNLVGGPLNIAHLHVPDDNIRSGSWSAGDVDVSPEHRRKGVATHMYRVMAKHLDMLPEPASIQSDDGKKLWEGLSLTKLDQEARAEITFGPDITQGANISLLEGADLSSYLHELGHFYLEVLNHLASQENPSATALRDMNKLLKWFGVPDIETWNSMTLDQKRPFHERFAEGFETYLYEGKAPVSGLAATFGRIRSWMIAVYNKIMPKVELSDEVRGVFDRMIATEEQIKEAEAARGYIPLFKNAEEAAKFGLDWDEYQALNLAATEAGIAQLQAKTLGDLKWLERAKSKKLRELQRTVIERRREVEKEVRAEVYRTPVHALMRFLKYGTVPEGIAEDMEFTGVHKLDIDTLQELHDSLGGNVSVDFRTLGTGKYGMLGKDGLPPQMVADAFGFRNVYDMLQQISEAEDVRAVIERETDKRMLERHGELSTPEALERAVNEAVANDVRARFLETELKALSTALGRPRILGKAAKDFAAQIIARLKIRDVRPNQYEAAATRAARNAERTTNFAEKVREKRNQLINHYAHKAALDTKDEVAKAIKYLKKFLKDGTRKNISLDYLEQIDAILERYDLKAVSKDAAARRQSLVEWVKEQNEMGFDPDIPKDVLSEAERIPYQDMTVEAFRGMVDSVRQIEKLGKLKNKLLAAVKAREFKEAKNLIVSAVQENATKVVPEARETDRAPLVNVTKWFKGFTAEHRKFASYMQQFDGWKDGGIMWELFVQPMNKAGDFETEQRETYGDKLAKVLQPLVRGNMSTRVPYPRSGLSLSREEVIGIALNLGNEINRDRILSGEGMTPEGLTEILASLDAADFQAIQNVWDLLEEFRPMIAEKQARIGAKEPTWVESAVAPELEAAAGRFGLKLKGGYYPIKYSNLGVAAKPGRDEVTENLSQMMLGRFSKAYTKDGHLQERVKSVGKGKRLRYDFASILVSHGHQVIHDLAWHEWVTDTNRLLKDSDVRAAIVRHHGNQVMNQLTEHVTDIAVGELPSMGSMDTLLNHMRYGASIVGMGYRLTTAMVQISGITQSMSRIGSKWVLKGAFRWMGDAASLENSVRKIREKSTFMRHRGLTQQREMNELLNTIKRSKLSRARATAFFFIQKMQMVVDVPTWWGAYEKAMHQTDMTEEKAVALADQAVIDAQGGGQLKDLSGIEKGGAFQRAWTTFYSFFNTTYNLTARAFGRTSFTSPSDVALLAVDMALIYSIPAMLGTLLHAALNDDWDDPEQLAKKMIADQLTYLMGTMVGLRELAPAVRAGFGEYGEYRGPAATRMIVEIGKFGQQVAQGEIDEPLMRAAANATGTIFHLPLGQIINTIDGMIALANGETENPGVLIVGDNQR